MARSDRSSFHRLCGDEPLSRLQRAAWLGGGILHAHLPRSRLPVRTWAPDPDLARPDLIPEHATPARVLANLFWESLPGAAIREALGDAVHVLDVGCGRGNYAAVLDTALGLGTYRGIDVREDSTWQTLAAADERLEFLVCRAEELGDTELAGRNLIVSQSALEHVRDDLAFFRRIAGQLGASTRPLLQIHLLPGANLWRLWGVHGYRGYSERNLRHVVALFTGSHVDVIKLGGPACNRLHLEAVNDTLRRFRRRPGADMRSTDPDLYRRLVAEAIFEDAARPPEPTLRDASFVALVVRTRLPDLKLG
jgi:SAM-dependent methyltransferase